VIAVVRRFPLRCGLLALTVIALPIVMWNAWPLGSGLALAFIVQAVGLARAIGLEPADDPAAPQNRKTS